MKLIVDSSLTSGRQRFERELHRLRGFDFARVLIVGTESDIINHRYRSKTPPKSVLRSLYAFEARYGIPFVFGGSERRSAALIERWSYWHAREAHRNAKFLVKQGGLRNHHTDETTPINALCNDNPPPEKTPTSHEKPLTTLRKPTSR